MNLNSSNASNLNALTFNVNNFTVLNLQMNVSGIASQNSSLIGNLSYYNSIVNNS